MTAHACPGVPIARGAAPVGCVLDLAPLEMQLVIYQQLWCSGLRGQTEVWQDLEARLGARNGRAALVVFERFFHGVTAGERRPLQRHAT